MKNKYTSGVLRFFLFPLNKQLLLISILLCFTLAAMAQVSITQHAAFQTVECDGSGNTSQLEDWLNTQGGALAETSCVLEGITWSYSPAILTEGCGGTGSFEVSFTATDDCGYTDVTIATFTIGDITPPGLTGTPYPGTSGTDACKANAATAVPFSNVDAIQGYTDNCGGPVTAILTETEVAGTNCSWTITYTFTVADACGNALTGQTYSNTGGDKSIPILTGSVPFSETNLNLCYNEIPDGPTEEEIKALFIDECGEVVVSKSGTPVGNNCAWSVTYTYSIKDACDNAADDIVIIYSGGSKTAPFLTETAFPGTSGIDACKSGAVMAAPFSPEDAIQGYAASCGGVVAAALKDTNLSGTDCNWIVTYTFDVSDGCGNVLTEQTYSNTGGNSLPPVFGTVTPFVGQCNNANLITEIHNWLNGVSATYQCGGQAVVTNNFDVGDIPDYGCYTKDVTFTATDACGNVSTIIRKLSLNTNTAVKVVGPASVAYGACGFFNDDLALPDLFNDWISQFGVSEQGCGGIMPDLSGVLPPDLCGGGQRTITYTYSDGCTTDSHSATFQVLPCYITANDGEWTNPSTWKYGCVPSHTGNNLPSSSRIYVMHDVNLTNKSFEAGGGSYQLHVGSNHLGQTRACTLAVDKHFIIRGSLQLTIYENLNPVDPGNNGDGSYLQIGVPSDLDYCAYKFPSTPGNNYDYAGNMPDGHSLFWVRGSNLSPRLHIQSWGTFRLYGHFLVENNFQITIDPDATFDVKGGFEANNSAKVNLVGAGGSIGCDVVFKNTAKLEIDGGDFYIGGNMTFMNGGNISMSNSSAITIVGVLCSSPGGGNAVLHITGDTSEPPNEISYGSICDNANITLDDNVVFPIELLSFGSRVYPDHVELQWVTATEINNHYFTLERSINLFEWDILGYVHGAGTSSEIRSYHFIDYSPVRGPAYYRLKQTDFDGSFEYFNPIAVSFNDVGNSLEFKVLKGSSMWSVHVHDDDSFILEVFSLSGNKIFSGSGTGSINFPAPLHPVIIRVINGNMQHASRVLMQN